jgi:regulator of replication initiation timing
MSLIPTGERELSINASDGKNRLFLGNCPNHRQLADELVEAFTEKIVKLSAENARLQSENENLKNKLNYLEDKDDDILSARIIQSIEVIKRC